MKIGLPKIRFSRKMLLISVGLLALLAGSAAAALYAGAGDSLMKTEPQESPGGAACDTVQTMVLKTPLKRLWLRRTIRMDHADGPTRIKTALRIAGLLANANAAVDLIQVNVLDRNGPTVRADMRGRAIGAEVILAMQPKYLSDMKEPFVVRYYEGMPSDEGRYYGERVSMEVPEIQKLMAAMRNVPDKADCTPLPMPENSKAKTAGEHVVSSAEDHSSGEQAKPTEKKSKAGEHGAEPAEKEADAAGHNAPKKEKSFLDSVLSMVGLGGSEEKPAEKESKHEAKAEDHSAVADDGLEPAPPADHEASEPAGQAETHAEAKPEVKPAH